MFQIHRLTLPEEAEQVLPLMGQVFGPRANTIESFRTWITRPECSVLLSRSGGASVAGVSVARYSDDDVWIRRLTLPRETLEPYLNRRMGDFQILAVDPAYRRSGLGYLLCEKQKEWMVANGCHGAIGTAWEHGHTDSSHHLFRRENFKPIGEMKDFYLEGSRKHGHSCPICQGECHCSALLYGQLWPAQRACPKVLPTP